MLQSMFPAAAAYRLAEHYRLHPLELQNSFQKQTSTNASLVIFWEVAEP